MDAEEIERRVEANAAIGIPGYQRALYHISIQCSVGASCESFKRYDAALLNNHPDRATIVNPIHDALGHAAAVSRYFWHYSGDRLYRKLHKARAKTLREMYKVDCNSALNNRDLRNTLEHFDERLDRFLLEEVAGVHLPMPSVGTYVEPSSNNVDRIYKMVDPESEIFVIFDEAYDFGKIRRAVDALMK